MKKIFSLMILLIFAQTLYAAGATPLKLVSEKLIKEAKVENKKSIKLKNEWRDTNKLIKKSMKAHANKDYENSILFAEQALNQAKMSIEQHNKQKDNVRFLDE
tara:strand:+ start:927 stop:1235 length:309 start_codon:yes stop_codon:yes gene_type:complete